MTKVGAQNLSDAAGKAAYLAAKNGEVMRIWRAIGETFDVLEVDPKRDSQLLAMGWRVIADVLPALMLT